MEEFLGQVLVRCRTNWPRVDIGNMVRNKLHAIKAESAWLKNEPKQQELSREEKAAEVLTHISEQLSEAGYTGIATVMKLSDALSDLEETKRQLADERAKLDGMTKCATAWEERANMAESQATLQQKKRAEKAEAERDAIMQQALTEKEAANQAEKERDEAVKISKGWMANALASTKQVEALEKERDEALRKLEEQDARKVAALELLTRCRLALGHLTTTHRNETLPDDIRAAIGEAERGREAMREALVKIAGLAPLKIEDAELGTTHHVVSSDALDIAQEALGGRGGDGSQRGEEG